MYEQIKVQTWLRRNDFMPIVDDNRRVVDVTFWDDERRQTEKENPELNLPVVIIWR